MKAKVARRLLLHSQYRTNVTLSEHLVLWWTVATCQDVRRLPGMSVGYAVRDERSGIHLGTRSQRDYVTTVDKNGTGVDRFTWYFAPTFLVFTPKKFETSLVLVKVLGTEECFVAVHTHLQTNHGSTCYTTIFFRLDFISPLTRRSFEIFAGKAIVYSNQVKKAFKHMDMGPYMDHGQIAR